MLVSGRRLKPISAADDHYSGEQEEESALRGVEFLGRRALEEGNGALPCLLASSMD